MRFKICLVIEVSSSDMSLPDNGIVNFWGPPGTGKTTYFEGIKHIKFDHDILKTKEKTIDFMQRMRYSKLHLVLDDFELVETLSGIDELKPRKHAALYIISIEKISLPGVTHFYEHKSTPESLQLFADSIGLKASEARKRLELTKGNMTTVKIDELFFASERDSRYCPKSYVSELLNGKESTSEFLDRVMFEHGNTLGLIHENYVDYVSSCECMANITDSFSFADMIDTDIYTEISWNLVTYFNVSSCLIPAVLIRKDNANTKKTQLRPGSIWTKYSNTCMKANRLKRLKVNRDCIELCVKYINNENFSVNTFDSYDLDTLNQLSLSEKIKPKILSKLKAVLKSVLK